MRLDADRQCLVCDYCGRTHFPDPNQDGVRVLGRGSARQCPVCRVALVQGTIGGEMLLYCETCGGMLIPVDDFQAIVDALRAGGAAPGDHPPPLEWLDLDRKLACPQCHAVLDTHPYGGPGNIVIDTCETCQYNWLDRGELMRVVRARDRIYS